MPACKKKVMEYADAANVLRVAADALEDAQRAKQHLWALRVYWETMSDQERREAVDEAYERLCRFYEAQRDAEQLTA